MPLKININCNFHHYLNKLLNKQPLCSPNKPQPQASFGANSSATS